MAATEPWNLPEVQDWQKSAQTSQNFNQEMFGKREYDVFDSTDCDMQLLREKIAFIMCEPSSSEDTKLNQCQRQKEEKRIQKVFDLVCQANTGQKLFRVSFVCIDCLSRKERFFSSVIRLHLPDDKSVFIDNIPRSYQGFQDFLDNNRLPKCLMCYPASGSYYLTKGKIIEDQFKKSPACSIVNKVLLGTDIASVAIGVVAVPVGIASIFIAPLAIPAVVIGSWVTGGVLTTYSLGRSIERLVDRSEHGQTLGLQSPEARNCWLAIGGTAAFVTSVGAIIAVRQAIVSGAEITSTLVRVPTVISLSASGVGVANSFATIVTKFIQGDSIDATDWMFFMSSILFFGNVVVTAYQTKVFVTVLVNNGVQPKSFLSELVDLVKAKVEWGSLVHPNAVGYLTPLKIFNTISSPEANMLTCFQEVCKFVTETTKKIIKKLCTAAMFLTAILSKLWEFWTTFGNEMQAMLEWFCKIKGKGGLSGVFGRITSPEALEVARNLLTMGSWLQRVALDYHEPLADIIALQAQAGTVRPEDGVEEWTEEFQRTCNLLKKEFERQKASYHERFETAKRYSSNLSESVFQEGEGITGPLKGYLWKKALTHVQEDFNGEASLLRLTKGLSLANPGSSGLVDPETGMTVYFYHGLKPADNDQQLSSEQIVSLVQEKVGSELVQGATLEIDRESRLAFFRGLPSNAEGVSCVIVQCVPEGGFVAGNIYVVKADAD